MATVIAVLEVDDVARWLSSSKRAEFFGAREISKKAFVSPSGEKRVE